MLSFVVLLMFALMLIVTGYTISILSGLGSWNRTYYRLSQKYGGKGKSGGVMYGYYFSTPTLFFDYGRTYCKLKSRRDWLLFGARTTELRMHWPALAAYLSIVCPPGRNLSDTSGKTPEEDSFFTKFDIRANQITTTERMITPSLKWQLEKLRTLNPKNYLNVTLIGRHLTVSKPGFITDYGTLHEFIRLSLELFDLLMLSEEDGISFVTQTDVQLVENVNCPVCIGKIEGPMVVCRRCRTPHCRECWEYNGRCATFACEETSGESAP